MEKKVACMRALDNWGQQCDWDVKRRKEILHAFQRAHDNLLDDKGVEISFLKEEWNILLKHEDTRWKQHAK